MTRAWVGINRSRYLSPEESVEVNLKLKRLLDAKANGMEVNWADVAKDVGLTHDTVLTRVSRLRRGIGVLTLVPDRCECDSAGPCLACFQKQEKKR